MKLYPAIPGYEGRDIEPPNPNENAVHSECRKARNDVINLFRMMDRYYDREVLGQNDISAMMIEMHLLMNDHLCRINRMERKLGRVCHG